MMIHHNKFELFKSTYKQSASREKLQVALLKCDAKLYIGCQTREGNLEENFFYKNQVYPPALPDNITGTKSGLLSCLSHHSDCQHDAPRINYRQSHCFCSNTEAYYC